MVNSSYLYLHLHSHQPVRHIPVSLGEGRPCQRDPCLSEWIEEVKSIKGNSKHITILPTIPWISLVFTAHFVTSFAYVLLVLHLLFHLHGGHIGVDHHRVDAFLLQRLDRLNKNCNLKI